MIFDVKRFALHDGPGIRTTVFFKGCPLHCLWCHNPESQAFEQELLFRVPRCDRCGHCLKACERDAISLTDESLSIDRGKCALCGACARVCPAEAVEMIGWQMTVSQVMAKIEKDLVFYDQSGGGVTFSGGEPLSQPGFLSALLEACTEKGIHTALDTCGFADRKTLHRIGENVDLFLYDLKLMDNKRHQRFTGRSNRSILRNLRDLSQQGRSITVRLPVIPGMNVDDENIFQIGEFVASLASPHSIEILPYHWAGSSKWDGLGRPYRLVGLQSPSEERLTEVAERLRSFALNVTIGGETYADERTDRAPAAAKPAS